MAMLEHLVHPDTRSRLVSSTPDHFLFEDGSKLPVHDGTPILFSEHSIFSAGDIVNSKKTTQDTAHLDTKNLKNYIRRRLLPSLCNDFNIDKRYAEIARLLPAGSKVLVVGTGEKRAYYSGIFSHCAIAVSDVHDGFKPDFVFDGHFIPFEDGVFDLVLAAQVIEHVMNPWQFAAELQRVVKIGGLLQVEAPQNYPYHAEPYDFFRFTFTGLRSLFPQCEVVKASITEGNASMVAVSASTWLMNTTSVKLLRSSWLFVTRILFGWMKYLDRLELNRRTVSMPKGYAFTFRKDAVVRKPAALLDEFYQLKP